MMGWFRSIALLLLLPAAGFAQEIPAGTALPVMLRSTLDAKKDKRGQSIQGRLMQDVTLPSGQRIPSGARVTGQIVDVEPSSSLSPRSRMVVQFDKILYDGKVFPITVHLRAIASMMDVYEAQLPTGTFDDYGTTMADWTTIQIGGDVVYRGDGTVVSQYGDVVARANDTGYVWGKLKAVPADGCHASSNGEAREESLWLFSTSACGTYGFADLRMAHKGRTPPVGQIELQANRDLLISAGSGWLLLITKVSP